MREGRDVCSWVQDARGGVGLAWGGAMSLGKGCDGLRWHVNEWLRVIVARMSGIFHDDGGHRRHWKPSTVAGAATAVEWLGEAAGGGNASLAEHIAELMREIPATRWIELDRALRSPLLTPRGARRLVSHEPAVAVELLGVATMSADGYTREAAVELLAQLGHPRAVPYVLLRLADWVMPVRETAVTALRVLLDGASLDVVEALLDHHRLIERLPCVERADLHSVHEEILAFLRSAPVRGMMMLSLSCVSPPRRRFCFAVLGDVVLGDAQMTRRALLDSDPAVRRWLARRVAARPEAAFKEVIECLLGDPSASVAAAMVRSLPHTQLLDHVKALRECALADARPTRQAARFALRDIDGFDAAATARARLDGSPAERVHPGWVATLGEVGVAGDAPRVAMLLASDRARVREAALSALGRLSPGEAIPSAVAMLRDTSGRVRRAAVSILVRSPRDQWHGSVAEVQSHGAARSRAAAIAVLATLPGWEPMPYLIDGVLDEDAFVRLRAWQNIDAWQRQYGTMGWVTPSPECREAIARRLSKVQAVDDVPDFAARSWSALRSKLATIRG